MLRRKCAPCHFGFGIRVCKAAVYIYPVSHSLSLPLVKESFLHDVAKCHPQSQAQGTVPVIFWWMLCHPLSISFARATRKYNTIWECQAFSVSVLWNSSISRALSITTSFSVLFLATLCTGVDVEFMMNGDFGCAWLLAASIWELSIWVFVPPHKRNILHFQYFLLVRSFSQIVSAVKINKIKCYIRMMQLHSYLAT